MREFESGLVACIEVNTVLVGDWLFFAFSLWLVMLIRQRLYARPVACVRRPTFLLDPSISQVGYLPKFSSPMLYFADLPKFYVSNVLHYTVVSLVFMSIVTYELIIMILDFSVAKWLHSRCLQV